MRCRSRLRLTNIHRLKRATCPVCGKNSFHRQNLATLL
jgi:ribosomal protein L37E